MKNKKTFAVRIEIDANIIGMSGITCEFKANQMYFSDMILEKKNEILEIIPVIKKIKDLRIERITIYLQEIDQNYCTNTLDQYRLISRYGENKFSKFNGNRFNFDSEESKTDMTIYEFIKTYSEILNSTAYYNYMKYISDIER